MVVVQTFSPRSPGTESKEPHREEFDELGEGVGLSEATIRFQQHYIRTAIKRVQGNMSEAARLLGLHRSNLYRKMRQLEMDADEAKP